MARAKTTAGIDVPPLKLHEFDVWAVGDSILVTHKWSEKAKEQIRAKQQKKAKPAKEAKNPQAEYNGARYLMEDGRDGIPPRMFKQALVDAASYVDGITKVMLRGAVMINMGEELLPLEFDGDEPIMREDVVRLQGTTADLRYRPEYRNWRVKLTIRFNPLLLSQQQILHLLQHAGFSVGVGESRPQRNGEWGCFHIEPVEE